MNGRGARRLWRGVALAGALAAAACAEPRQDLVVLLPAADGHVGRLEVQDATGSTAVLDRPLAAARFDDDDKLAGGAVTRETVDKVFGSALGAQPMRPFAITLNFKVASDELTAESRERIKALFADVARRRAYEIEIVGHTDGVGGPQVNDPLSLQRAQAIRAQLVQLGLPGLVPTAMSVIGRGDREPLVPAGPDTPEPRNRRVQVTVR